MTDSHIKELPLLWIMIGIVAAGAGVWLTYLITQLEWDVQLATGIALLASLVLLAGMFPIPVAPRVKGWDDHHSIVRRRACP